MYEFSRDTVRVHIDRVNSRKVMKSSRWEWYTWNRHVYSTRTRNITTVPVKAVIPYRAALRRTRVCRHVLHGMLEWTDIRDVCRRNRIRRSQFGPRHGDGVRCTHVNGRTNGHAEPSGRTPRVTVTTAERFARGSTRPRTVWTTYRLAAVHPWHVQRWVRLSLRSRRVQIV